MDAHALGVLIPIIALLIPVVAIVMGGLQKIKRMQIEEATLNAGLGGSEEEIRALRDELEQLRGEVGEMQERLDFTERLLARNAESERLPKPQ